MKRMFIVLLLVLKLKILILISGHADVKAQDREVQLIGKWKMDGTKTAQDFKTEDRMKLNETSEGHNEIIKKSLDNRIYYFNKDLSFKAEWESNGKNNTVSGSWNYNEEGFLEIFVHNTGKKYAVKLDDQELVLTPQFQGKGMLQRLFFTKSN